MELIIIVLAILWFLFSENDVAKTIKGILGWIIFLVLWIYLFKFFGIG